MVNFIIRHKEAAFDPMMEDWPEDGVYRRPRRKWKRRWHKLMRWFRDRFWK